MSDIYRIAERLNVDYRIIRLIKKEILLPQYLNDFNPSVDYWYPHPPCLVPLFLGQGASYTGLTKHFFFERKSTFVEYSIENGYLSEIGRSADQFITLLVLKMIIIKDGLNAEIVDFCKALDFEQYVEIEQFALEYGDDPQEYKHLVFFKTQTPFKYIKVINEYDGDFPSSLYILNSNTSLQDASSFEISPVEKFNEIEDLSPWLIEESNKKDLFEYYLSNNKLKEAWLTLNSKNWLLKDVYYCLEELKRKANDDLFSLVADYWTTGWTKSNFLDSRY